MAFSNPSLIDGSALCAFDKLTHIGHYSLRLLNSKVNVAELGTSINVMRPPERRPGQVELTHCPAFDKDVHFRLPSSITSSTAFLVKARKAAQGLRLVGKSMYLILLTPMILCS